MANDMIWLPVAPSFKGFGAAMVKEVTGASRQAADRLDADMSAAGKKAGSAAGKGVADGVKSSAAEVEKASRAVAQARKREADAAANVLKAEARVEESRQKGAGSEQLARQEATLEQHRRRQESAARQLSAAEQDVQSIRDGGAGRAQAVIRTENQLEKARLDAAQASDRVELAEAKVTELRYSGETSATKIANAEADLVKARSEQASATDVLSGKEALHVATLEDVEQQAKATADAVEDAGEKSSKSGGFMSKAADGAKKLAIGLGAAAATGIGVALTKGFQRINQIDQATAKLTGLGHSAEAVEQIMTSATDAVTGTAYGMGDAATVAAATVAAGVKPGEDLTRTLKLVGDAATIAGTDMSTMGSIVNKVATSDMMQMDVANQLMDAGIPILQMVGEQMGVTAEEARNLASEGKVSFETFQSALESGLGGAALESGNTLQGSLDNLMAAMGRLGESALKPFIQDGKDLIGMLTEWVNSMTAQVGPAVEGFADFLVNTLIPAIKDAASWIRDNKDWLAALVVGVVAGTAAFKTYQGVLLAVTAAKKLWATATIIADKGMKGLNATMKANVIGLVVAAIAALVAGLVWFFTQTETGQKAWSAFTDVLAQGWEWVKNAFSAGWNVVKGVLDWLGSAFEWVGEIIGNVFSWMVDNWQLVVAVVFGPLGAIVALAITYWDQLKAGVEFVWQAIQTAISWAWNGVILPIWNALTSYLQFVGSVFQFVWNSVIKPAWDALGAGIAWVWNSIIKPAWDALRAALSAVGSHFQMIWNSIIKPAWDALGAGIRTVIESVIKPAWDGLKSALSSVGDFFSTVVDGIRVVWDKMREHVARPINFVIETVWNNGLVAAWNKIQEFLPGLPRASTLSPVRFAEGGPVPMMPGAVAGKDSVHALMMPNEHVWDVRNVDSAGGHGTMYQMRDMVDNGQSFTWTPNGLFRSGHDVAHFAEGGEVNGARLSPSPGEGGLQPIAILAKRLIHRIWPEITSIGGYRAEDGYGEHSSGRALDVMVGVGNPVGDEVTSWALANDHVLPLIHAIWKQMLWFTDGRTQMMGDRGNPTQNHFDHPHLWYHPKSVDPNTVPAGLVGHDGLTREDRLGVIKEKIAEILDKALDPIKEGMSRVIGDPPPEMLGIPPIALDRTKEAAVDGAFSFAENIAGDLKDVYNQAKDVVTSITGLFRDEGGFIPPGKSIVTNETGKPEAVLNWDQLEQVVRLMESAQGLEALAEWASGDPRKAIQLGVEEALVDAVAELGVELAESMEKVLRSAGEKALTGYRDEALDFFGFKGLADGIAGVWNQANSPATDATTAGATSAIATSGPTSAGGGVTTHGDPNLTYETHEVELETKMPALSEPGVAGSGPVVDQVKEAFAVHGWDSGDQWAAVDWIIGKESSWNPTAQNPTSTAYGLFQFLDTTWPTVGATKTDNPKLQAEAGAAYIKQRYGDPLGAKRFWEANNWYDNGGWLMPGLTMAVNGTGKPEAILTAAQWDRFDDLLVSLPSAAQFERIASLADADSVEMPEPRAAGPLLHIENLVARDEDEAMRAAAREARRLSRSSAMVGGW